MPRLLTLVAIAGASFCAQSYIAAADDVPKFDFRQSCHADIQAYPGGGGDAGCVEDEQKAREAVVSQWSQFAPGSRARCIRMVTSIAGAESYVELLTCLQLGKDLKKD
jgi:hypothetical protein